MYELPPTFPRRKTKDCRKLENFEKIPEMLGIDDECPVGHPKDKF